jgi:ParB-like chromosome segregation protein Spo0J
MRRVKAAFKPNVVRLSTAALVLTRKLDSHERHHQKYKQIASSLASVGLIEPLVVVSEGKTFRVLDGHKRLDILVQMNVREVECLLSTDDEAYTYNRRVNYLSTVGETHMILKALEHNSEQTIAKALNVDVITIRKKRDTLNGICKEAIDILKTRKVPTRTFAALRKMKPTRQIEVTELMVASNRFSGKFAYALLAGTRDEMRVNAPKQNSRYLSAAQRARLAKETEQLLSNTKSLAESYGTDILSFNIICRYLEKLVRNAPVSQYLKEQHAEIMGEFRSILEWFHTESKQVSKSNL